MKNFHIIVQHLLPKHLITLIAGSFANAKAGSLTTAVIRWFVSRYNVNMKEAANPDITAYHSFNDFFTRTLQANARPITEAAFICPVDGAISQFGDIVADQIFQAKGHSYSTKALLAGDQTLAAKFRDGSFATLYLSPKDYHRIHMPCDGRLISMRYVPGALFSVNPATAQGVAGLFARNERVVCEFESKVHGTFVMVLVGATIVGSMATIWHGVVNPPRSRQVREWTYSDQNIELKQGEEMGKFLLGSTVVLLFKKNTLAFNPAWIPAKAIRLGEVLATIS